MLHAREIVFCALKIFGLFKAMFQYVYVRRVMYTSSSSNTETLPYHRYATLLFQSEASVLINIKVQVSICYGGVEFAVCTYSHPVHLTIVHEKTFTMPCNFCSTIVGILFAVSCVLWACLWTMLYIRLLWGKSLALNLSGLCSRFFFLNGYRARLQICWKFN